MSSVEVRPVRTSAERKAFLTFPWQIYRDDPQWVPPLLPERAQATDPRRGKFFRRGEAEFFVAWRDGKAVGTICAAEDPPTNEVRKKQECLFGFFEYVDDEEVASSLVRQAIEWALARHLDALYGPFNLDYEDGYGVLLEGRDRPPALLCGHSPSYYPAFMDRFGFVPARGDNLAFAIATNAPGLSRLSRLADRVRERLSVSIRHADLAQWDKEVDRVHRLLNVGLDKADIDDLADHSREVTTWPEDRLHFWNRILAQMDDDGAEPDPLDRCPYCHRPGGTCSHTY